MIFNMLLTLSYSKHRLTIRRLLVINALLLAPIVSLSGQGNEEGISNKIKKIDSEIQELTIKNKKRKSQIGKTKQNLQVLDKKIIKNSARLNDLNKSIKKKQKHSKQLQKQAEKLANELIDEKDLLAIQLRNALINQEKIKTATLLNAQPFSQYLRSQQYFSYFKHHQNLSIKDLQARSLKLMSLREEITNEEKTLNSLKKKTRKKHAALNSKQNQQKSLATTLTNDQSKSKKKLLKLAANRDALNQLLEKLRYQSAHPESSGNSKFARLQGQLGWPLKGKVRKHTQPGVTIATSSGQKVRAIAAGSVVFAGQMRGFGLLAIIDHGGGYMSLYGHNQDLLTKKGEQVVAGSAIATSGTNTATNQAGLYFEIRYNAAPVDPRKWCKAS